MHKMLTEYQLANFRNLMAAGHGIPLSDLGPQGAFDSMPKSMSRRARDADPESVARGLANMLTALREQLGDEDFKALCARVCDEDEPEAEGEDEGEETFVSPEEREMADKPTGDKRRAKDKKTAKDEPAPFEGKPSTGTAMDAASDPRFDYLRDAALVKPSQPGNAYGNVSSQAARNGAVSKSFEAMYPAAANIKVR